LETIVWIAVRAGHENSEDYDEPGTISRSTLKSKPVFERTNAYLTSTAR
jgi:hypothetical protein